MPLTSIKTVALGAGTLLLGTFLVAQERYFPAAGSQEIWHEITGSAEPTPELDVPQPMPTMLAQTSEVETKPSQPVETQNGVDESALRYFARKGDTRRLEIEIARLRALYPGWTPPADPLATPPVTDAALEEIWELYSQGRLSEARHKIAERQASVPGWQPPADLTDRLALAESRERLINASDLDQYATVISVASQNPQLLTCSEVDVLWRVAEAFARTDRDSRAYDAYRYILSTCDDAEERLATMQNALQLLPMLLVDDLLALERSAGTVGEFAEIRDTLARNAVAKAGEDKSATVPATTLDRLKKLAETEKLPTDARLLGWYYYNRQDIEAADKWFRMALSAEPSADAAEGLALVLIQRELYADAEELMYRWRDDSDDTRVVYLAAVANLLGLEPRPLLSGEVLSRIVAEVARSRNVEAARQLGWYARAFEQHATAKAWFTSALGWGPDDEPSAYGLALTYQLLGETAQLDQLKQRWAGRSERIQLVGVAETEPAPAGAAGRSVGTAAPVTPPAIARIVEPNTAPAASSRRANEGSGAKRGAGSARGCSSYTNPERLQPAAALSHGWCLMDADRPLEAAKAFEVALRGGNERTRRDAAYGQSLAYLRAGLVDNAAVAAIKAPQSGKRAVELQTNILDERARGAFERGRYAEAIMALDRRAQIAPERIDLMVLRGYSYMRLNRLGDARRVFEAVARTGSRDGIKGLAELNNLETY